ncbi:MAG: TonB-dependent receptor [Pseudomonadota bacterium]
MNRFQKRLLGACLLSTAFAPIAFAQDASSAQDASEEVETKQLDTITVTARKRTESLQDVPLAVTAFDQAALEATHADTINEIEKFVPNVEFSDISFSGQTLGATIRGIGFADIEKTYEPAVGVSVDGVFLATNTGASVDLFDVEAVEVLRGPQGTLYGRNTVGGVLNINRTRPTGEAGLRLLGRLGNNGQEEFMAVANAPQIGDVLSSKFYVFSDSSETFSDNLATGEPDKLADSLSYGAAFLFEPNEKLQALVSVDFIDDESGTQPIYNLSQDTEVFCILTLGIPGVSVTSDASGCASTSFDIVEASGFDVHVRDFPSLNALESQALTANVTYEINPNLNFTSITGYRSTEEEILLDNIGAPNAAIVPGVVEVPIFISTRLQDLDQLSQEFRLDGQLNSATDFVAGLFYMNTEYDLAAGDGGPDLMGPATVFVFGAPSGNYTAGQELNAYAAFFDATYQITDQLSVSGGLRYTYEEKDFDIDFIFDGLGAFSVSDDWNEVTGRLILQYDFSDDIMAFGGWSRGFRSGGFNGRATVPDEIGPFDPETVDSFEAGLRMELADRRLRLNPTVFFTQYNDKQEPIIGASPINPNVTATVIENSSKVEYSGFELEALFLATDELTLRGSLGLLDAEVSEFLVPDLTSTTVPAPLIDVSDGRIVTNAPETTYSVGFDYVRPFSNEFELRVNGSHSYTAEHSIQQTPDPFGRNIIDAQDSTDLSITLATTRGDQPNYAITLFGLDIFDEDPGVLDAGLNAGVFYFGVGAPTRRYGIELSAEF